MEIIFHSSFSLCGRNEPLSVHTRHFPLTGTAYALYRLSFTITLLHLPPPVLLTGAQHIIEIKILPIRKTF
jgi:hypothetical protein